MKKKIKKIIFPGTTLALSSYVSIPFTAGVVVGYWGTNVFLKRFVKTGRINILIFDLGTWKFHLHHWIMGGLAISAIYFIGLFPSLPIFFIGTLGGLIFHDLHTDRNWHKVFYKK